MYSGWAWLPIEKGEHLLVIVPVPAGATTGRDEHVNEAEPPGGVLPADQNGVGVAY
jgi:hypothetical protein